MESLMFREFGRRQDIKQTARDAYNMADAMLEARK
jgi:hypothetical protein